MRLRSASYRSGTTNETNARFGKVKSDLGPVAKLLGSSLSEAPAHYDNRLYKAFGE